MLKKGLKKWKKVILITAIKKPVLAKEREERGCVWVVETRTSICHDMSWQSLAKHSNSSKAQESPQKTSKGQESPARPSKAQQSLAKAKPKKALVMTRPGKHSWWRQQNPAWPRKARQNTVIPRRTQKAPRPCQNPPKTVPKPSPTPPKIDGKIQ